MSQTMFLDAIPIGSSLISFERRKGVSKAPLKAVEFEEEIKLCRDCKRDRSIIFSEQSRIIRPSTHTVTCHQSRKNKSSAGSCCQF